MTVHRKPASDIPENALYDTAVSHLRIWSEHCMGALKSRFQCLRGLRVAINTQQDHINACRWITIAIILHNLVVDIEGINSSLHFAPQQGSHGEVPAEERDDVLQYIWGDDEETGIEKRKQLIRELVEFRQN